MKLSFYSFFLYGTAGWLVNDSHISDTPLAKGIFGLTLKPDLTREDKARL